LELWILRDGRFHRFATYPICLWSGHLGPKHKEGDRQSPEGFYTVDALPPIRSAFGRAIWGRSTRKETANHPKGSTRSTLRL
jgi:murein L,D-transpeptidase YafK